MNTINFTVRLGIAIVLQAYLVITATILTSCPGGLATCESTKLMQVVQMVLWSPLPSILLSWVVFGAFKNAMPAWRDGQPHLIKSILIGFVILSIVPVLSAFL